jgi:hypothetical protein|mmetsp:Transcript_30424/g.55039  ORF Transcript_30424/g.55039 Transcript_30424/m.55039 type:complete len:89 (-) Transcript_30424:68-334(-)
MQGFGKTEIRKSRPRFSVFASASGSIVIQCTESQRWLIYGNVLVDILRKAVHACEIATQKEAAAVAAATKNKVDRRHHIEVTLKLSKN